MSSLLKSNPGNVAISLRDSINRLEKKKIREMGDLIYAPFHGILPGDPHFLLHF